MKKRKQNEQEKSLLNNTYPIYKEEFLFTPQFSKNSILPTTIVCRVLSHKELLNNIFKYQRNGQETNMFRYHIVYDSIVSFESEKLDKKDIIELLDKEDIENLYQQVMEKSILPPDFDEKLETNLKVVWSDKLQGDYWSCEVCKERGLQKARACGFIPEEDRDEFMMFIEDKVFKQCPISVIDTELVYKAVECYRMYDKGILPEDGGLYDQTMFFVEATKIVQQVVKEQEQKALEDSKNKDY